MRGLSTRRTTALRRLLLAGLALLAALSWAWQRDLLSVPAASDAGLRATYEIPGGGVVLVEYASATQFMLTSSLSAVALLVDEGRFYLVQRNPGQADSIFWLADAPRGRALGLTRAATPLPVQALPNERSPVSAWHTLGALYQGAYGAPGAVRQVKVTGVKHRQLLAAQRAIVASLAQMDMAPCGPALQYLFQWWPPEMHAAGLAVLGNDAGLRLASPVLSLRWEDRRRLPYGAKVIDYRIQPQT
jgi:hypothetical protein